MNRFLDTNSFVNMVFNDFKLKLPSGRAAAEADLLLLSLSVSDIRTPEGDVQSSMLVCA